MEDKIIELISVLSIENDPELIGALYFKLGSIRAEKDFSYKYTIEKLSNREKSTLYMGLSKIVGHAYKSSRYDLALKLKKRIDEHYCAPCEYPCSSCPFGRRIGLIDRTIDTHEKIKLKIVSDLDPDLIITKYLVNKIILKLKTIKIKTV